MKYAIVIGMGFALALGAGCDDAGDDGSTGGNDGGGSGSAEGGGGLVPNGADVSCSDNLEVDPKPTKQAPVYLCDENPSTTYPDSDSPCRNSSDCEIIEGSNVRETARNCGLGCRDKLECDERSECNSGCVIMGTNLYQAPGLTPECADCYAEISACALEFCLSECAANADAPDCVFCQLAMGCRLPFERCSGLDRMN
jgi:hypothetical protein